MKYILKFRVGLVVCFAAMFILSGCVESRYYHRYHHHTRPWYDRHHMPPPAGVDFRVDVR
jgi:hypothetical protein